MSDIIIDYARNEVMNRIVTKINNDLAASNITHSEIAKYLGIAKSTLSSILNGKTEISFIYLAKIIMKLHNRPYVKLEDNVISTYLLHAKPENRREAFEYAAFRRKFDSLQTIFGVEEHKEIATELNQEFVMVYKLIYKHCKVVEKYSPEDFYDDLDECKNKVSSKEMKVLIDILLCQTLYQTKEYKKLFKRIADAEEKVKKIPNKFIQNSFLVRIKEVLIVTYMMRDEVQMARENCNDLLKICDENKGFLVQKANSYYNLGESYLFEDYSESNKFLKASLSVLNDSIFDGDKDIQRKKERVKSTIIFLKIHHSRDLNALPLELDDDDQAYLEIQLGNNEKAESILRKMEKEKGSLNEFQTCYLGIAQNNKALIEKSYMMFLQKKSLFYANLPKIYLGKI